MNLSLDEANHIAQVAIDKAEVLGNNISCGRRRSADGLPAYGWRNLDRTLG